MRNLIILLALCFTASVFAEDGIIFATKDDIRAFDRLIHKSKVRKNARVDRSENRVVKELVRKEVEKRKRQTIVRGERSGNKKVNSDGRSNSASAKVETSSRISTSSSGVRSGSWSRRDRKSKEMKRQRRERKNKRHKKKDRD